MNLSKVQEIYASPLIDSEINLGGWVRAFRANKFIELNGYKEAKEKGQVRQEGKEYIVQDGDIIEFLFNV